MSDPSKHHYLPVFYTKRWAGPPDGKLVAFRKWPKVGVRPNRFHPAGTGWARDLYSFSDAEPHLTQDLEHGFMSPVDSQAADGLARLETDGGRGAWTDRARHVWVTFVRTLLFRMPADIVALKRSYAERLLTFTPEEEERYRRAKGPDDPATATEFYRLRSAPFIADSALRLMPKITQTEEIGRLLMGWHWFVVDVDRRDHELLTSDRPVRTAALKLDDAYVRLPIGPRKMFWAVPHPKWERVLREGLPRQWVAQQNLETVRGANELVIGRTDASLAFVRAHMSAAPLPSFFERQREKRVEMLGQLRSLDDASGSGA